MALGDQRQEVPREVDAAALMARTLERPTERSDQPGVLIGDHEAQATKAAQAQRREEPALEHLILGVADIDAEHLALPDSSDPCGDHDGHRRHL